MKNDDELYTAVLNNTKAITKNTNELKSLHWYQTGLIVVVGFQFSAIVALLFKVFG